MGDNLGVGGGVYRGCIRWSITMLAYEQAKAKKRKIEAGKVYARKLPII